MSDINLTVDTTTNIVLSVSTAPINLSLALVGAQGASGASGTSDHGALTGLADDDHSQYHNDTRGDVRYYTKGQVDTSLAGKANTSHTHIIADTTGLQDALNNKSNVGHTHDDRYYTELEINAFNAALEDAIAEKADAIHTHAQSDVSGLVSALAGKEGTITAGTTAQYWRGDKTWQTLNKSAVGLGNVDNTSDAAKNSATVTLTNKTISGSNNTLSNIPNSALTTDPLDRTNHAGTQAISTVTNLQSELNTRFVILGKGTPLKEVYTDVFEEALIFNVPMKFMESDGNVIVVEMFMSWSENSAHEIEIKLFDDSANETVIGLYVTETGIAEGFLGRFTVTFISAPIVSNVLLGIIEVNGLIDATTLYIKNDLAFAIDGSPCNLDEQLTIQVNMRVPDNLSSIQSIYAIASTKMDLN